MKINNKIYIVDTLPLQETDAFEKNYALMSNDRKEKIDALKNIESKCQSLGAGIAFNRALMDLGLDPLSEKIEYGAQGAPYLINHPDIYFNISHSGERAICVISDTPVGCDVQQVGEFKEKLVYRFFSEEERSIIASADLELASDLFYRIWTLKESFIKATGKGMSQDMTAFSVSLENGGLVKHDSDEKYECYQLEAEDGYRYSICKHKK